MNAHELLEHDRRRLRLFLAHFVDHMASHVAEVRERGEAMAESGELRALLGAAVADMETSRRSMARVVDHLGQDETGLESGRPDHDHRYDHDHHHHADGHEHAHRHAQGEQHHT